MALMNFGIGPDMGFVLAKGIALSLLTVLLLMPALILRSQNIIAKTRTVRLPQTGPRHR